MEYTAENVERVVAEFYGSGQGNSSLHNWLTKAQAAPSSWGWAFSLIQPAKSVEVQFYGANTLAIKVSKCWSEVPADQAGALHERLFGLLRAYGSQGPKIVTTRLAVALAVTTIHRMSEIESDAIVNIVNTFQVDMQSQGVHVLTALLEFLTILPEECATMVMHSTRRAVVRKHMSECSPLIIDIVVKVLKQGNISTEVMVQNLKCLQAWVQFGLPMDLIPGLADQVFKLVRHEELLDQCLDTISSVIALPDIQKHPKTVRHLLISILTLDGQLEKWMAEESFEMAVPLANVFISFGESHSRFLVDLALESEEGRSLALRVARTILSITGCRGQFPIEERLSEMALSFWYMLQDDITSCDPPQYQQCVAVFGGLFSSLVQTLLRKSMFPLDDASWTADQKETLRYYRTDIGDAFTYCYNILHENLLDLLLLHFDDAMAKINMGQNDFWPQLEACLSAWSALAESVSEEQECPQAMQLLSQIPLIPYNNNSVVIVAALDCIGEYCELVCRCAQVTSSLLPLVLEALVKPEMCENAALALRSIVRVGHEHLGPFNCRILDVCHVALHTPGLKASARTRLMYPVGRILAGLPVAERMQHLEKILVPFLSALQNAASEQANPTLKSDIVFVLKSVTLLFQAVEQDRAAPESQSAPEPQPTAMVFTKMFPILKSVIFKWASDDDVMECSWAFLKQSSTVLFDCEPSIIGDVIPFIGMFYSAKPHEIAFNLARQLLLRQNTQYKPAISALLSHMIETTLKAIQSGSDLSEFADIIAAFFQLMNSFVKKDLHFLESTGVSMDSVLECAGLCVQLPEAGPVKASSNFAVGLISRSREVQGLNRVVSARGERLLLRVLSVAAREARRAFIDYFADMIMILNKKYFDDLCLWMNNFVKDASIAAKLTLLQKEQFSRSLLQERANKRKLVEILHEYSIKCEE